MERFTLLVTSRHLQEVHAVQIMAENKGGALQFLDGMEITPHAIFRAPDVELLTHLYYRVSETDVFEWMKGIFFHACIDKYSYWLLVDDDSEFEYDNLLNNVRKVVMEDQKRRRTEYKSVYPEYLHEVKMDELTNKGSYEDIEPATPEEWRIHNDGLGDLEEDENTLTDENGYMTIDVCDSEGDQVVRYRVPVDEE